MTEQRLKYLLDAYLDNRLTPVEQEEWVKAFQDPEFRETLNQLIDQTYHGITEEELTGLPAAKKEAIIQQIIAEEPTHLPAIHKPRLWPRIAVTASIVLSIAAGGYFLLKPKPAEQTTAKVQQDLKPGINGAILTLANGQKVVLEQTKIGDITAGIQKSNDSLLVYNNAEAIGYNTLETPKGRQYAVVLPDGSKVWLNAASSLRYPTRFTGNERLVELTGEGYFEVVHNGKMPFRVKTNKQTIEDIGTQFNVNAYADEQVTVTTLIEGAVKVNEEFLKPGFAALSKTSNTTDVKQVDIDEAIAWKNGAFFFDKTDIKTMMRQIGRWYDVEIGYEGPAPTKTISGKIHRNVNASQALQILSYLNIHYRIEDKKIIITK